MSGLWYQNPNNPEKNRIRCIRQSKELLGHDVCDHMLFIHILLGLDTSHRFGFGKGVAARLGVMSCFKAG
jgi:hypothetical protein